MAVMRKCACCGYQYEYCPSCTKSAQPAWMASFCSKECKDLFNTISAYNMKRIGKPALQAFIAEHGITDVSKYSEPIKKVLEEVSASAFMKNGTMVDTPMYMSRRKKKKNRVWNY